MDEYDIEVELALQPTDAGGMRRSVYQGYPALHVHLGGVGYVTYLYPVGREELRPGERGRVLVWFLSFTDELLAQLRIGNHLSWEQGGRIVGSSTVTAILDLDAHVRRQRDSQVEDARRSMDKSS